MGGQQQVGAVVARRGKWSRMVCVEREFVVNDYNKRMYASML